MNKQLKKHNIYESKNVLRTTKIWVKLIFAGLDIKKNMIYANKKTGISTHKIVFVLFTQISVMEGNI